MEATEKLLNETEKILKIIQQSNYIITQSMVNNVIKYYKNLIF